MIFQASLLMWMILVSRQLTWTFEEIIYRVSSCVPLFLCAFWKHIRSPCRDWLEIGDQLVTKFKFAPFAAIIGGGDKVTSCDPVAASSRGCDTTDCSLTVMIAIFYNIY